MPKHLEVTVLKLLDMIKTVSRNLCSAENLSTLLINLIQHDLLKRL